MDIALRKDLKRVREVLKIYVDKGASTDIGGLVEEPQVRLKPSLTMFSRLMRVKTGRSRFFAVDCSTRTLRRANNWGIYVFRVAYAAVKGRSVEWGFKESIRATRGDTYVRRKILQETRLQLESQMALDLLDEASQDDYILLDGASYFGGERKFNAMLYERCENLDLKLLALSKQSSTLRDNKGRDLIATTLLLAPQGLWVYHPVRKANIHEHLYGDITIVKLSDNSSRAFRCDIMNYLTGNDIPALLSPLLSISEDPRCLGYPIVLWLAHDFSGISKAKLLMYHARVEEELKDADLLGRLRQEELACNFADELHGVKYAFNWEPIAYV